MINRLAQQTILDFQQGDEKAFELVFKAYYTSIIVFTKKIAGSQEEAQDIATEVFLTLFNLHNHFNSEPNIRSFLYVSARNRCINYLKSKKRSDVRNQRFVERIQDDTLLEYEHSIKAEIVETIHNAIESLPEECRRIFKMLYYEELKPAEVAELLQISVNTVYVQKSRAVNMLRLKLSDNSLAIAWFLQVMAVLETTASHATHIICG